MDIKLDKAEDKVRQGLRKLARGREKLSPASIQQRLLNVSGLDSIALQKGMAALRRRGEVNAGSWDEYHGIPRTMLSLNLLPLPVPEHQTWWEEALERSTLPEDVRKLLRKDNIIKNVEGLSKEDMGLILAGLLELKNSDKGKFSEFVGSARLLLSSSKLLGSFGKAVRDALCGPGDCFRPAPRYVVVAGPPAPSAVLLIENPQCFEAAVEAGAAETVGLVSVYGYGLASTAVHQEVEAFWRESFGKDFSALIPLVRAGQPPSLNQLLAAKSVLWWGDLDLAGLDIFLRLKKRFARLRLSALYGPMVDILKNGAGHPYVACVGKEKQPSRYTLKRLNHSDLHPLLEVCARRAVDQEAVPKETIAALCSAPLAPS
ncbi:Wadjet anti-phage system protein JetD domain-containing protein [Desulfonatronum thiodismutans]|uniref:Wadjet anti-phage system protein JetD domain-containing protein n=1 Tax=Desulfonatronum thiodismutans TaxID=159290 RepID=UPI00069076C1|nr:Wadjet anti-phage system protein JetD domain-containing protein [Desulfonatronum thiodismutans]